MPLMERFEIQCEEIGSPGDNFEEPSEAGIRSWIRRITESFPSRSRRKYSLQNTAAPNSKFLSRKTRFTYLLWILIFLVFFLIIMLLIVAIVFYNGTNCTTRSSEDAVHLNSTFLSLQDMERRPRLRGDSLKKLQDHNFASPMKEYVALEGFELECHHARYNCYQPKVASKDKCAAVCRSLPSCISMVYASSAQQQERCRLYDRTPFEMMVVPHASNGSSMYLRRSEISAGVQKEDGRFYFVSPTAVVPLLAERVCRRGSSFYHLALLAFDERPTVSRIAKEMATRSANQTSEGLLLWVLTGRKSSPNDTYADVAGRVSSKLKFDQIGNSLNNKFLQVVYGKSSFDNPEYGKSYRVLCQGDPFNVKGQAQFYLNLQKWKISENSAGKSSALTQLMLHHRKSCENASVPVSASTNDTTSDRERSLENINSFTNGESQNH